MGKFRRRRESSLPREESPRGKRTFHRRQVDQNLAAAEELRAEGRRRQKMIVKYLAIGFVVIVLIAIIAERQVKDAPSPPPRAVFVWEPAPVFGEAAIVPAGCKEVTDTGLAPLEKLADGSELAREAQLTVANQQKFPVEIENTIGMRFRLIPNGSFIMGSPESEVGRGPDEPELSIFMQQPYYLGKFEVTQREWEVVMGTGTDPSQQKNGPDYPIEEVTWPMCQKFLTALCRKEGLPDWAYRLPTEAEWEYACRAGTQTPYYFGSDPKQLATFANYLYSTRKGKEPVGQRRPNAYGLYNMLGNLWEWCDDQFYYYDNPEIVDTMRRVLRGGHWHAEAVDCRSASRFRLPPDSNSNLLGFRVVRSIVKPPEKPYYKEAKPW